MKDFVPCQESYELKQLGFDEYCLGYYNIDPYLPNPTFNLVKPFDHEWCLPAPLYQQAFRWFREKYELSSWMYNSHMDKYFYTILKDGRIIKANESARTYEEAELACLKKLIELVKQKQ